MRTIQRTRTAPLVAEPKRRTELLRGRRDIPGSGRPRPRAAGERRRASARAVGQRTTGSVFSKVFPAGHADGGVGGIDSQRENGRRHHSGAHVGVGRGEV